MHLDNLKVWPTICFRCGPRQGFYLCFFCVYCPPPIQQMNRNGNGYNKRKITSSKGSCTTRNSKRHGISERIRRKHITIHHCVNARRDQTPPAKEGQRAGITITSAVV